MDVLMDAFRPFGCVGVRFPRPKIGHHHNRHHQQNSSPPSYAFVDFSTHEEASQCLANLKGEAVIRNIMLSLKWSSSGGNKKRIQPQPQMGIPPPPPPRRSRLTESECADSTTLFLRLPPTVDSSSYEKELEFMRLFAQRTMEDELNVGVPADSTDRITAADEPALRVQVRQPNSEMNYGFLTFASHAAALTSLVSLTGHEDGGAVSDDKLEAAKTLAKKEDEATAEASNLNGVTLYWAKGSQKSAEDNGKSGNYGLNLNKRHFPPDARTDCWFCLASPTCEKHLIVTVFDECYVAMPKGAVNEFHSLIVPVEHGGDGAFVTKKLAPEMETVKSKLRTHARAALQKDLFVFERCIQTKGGYHTHVQCIPVEAGSGPAIQSKMLEMSIRNGFHLREITSELSLNALEGDWSNGYFYVEIPLGGGDEYRRFIYRAGDKSGDEQGSRTHVPLQFGREVLAEVLNKPEIGHWKACVVSREKEEELTASFRTSLASLTS
jgi:diadenosine tetraphosphate (Ap4A) HIT family hydrolase